MNKKVLLAIIPALFILAGCQASQIKDQTASPSLKTVEVQKYGISIQYPVSWNTYGQLVDENSNLVGLIISPENEKNLKSKVGVAAFSLQGIGGDIKEDVASERRKLADGRMKMVKSMNKDGGVEIIEDEVVIDGVTMIREKVKNTKLQAADADFNSKEYVVANSSMYFFVHNNQKIMTSFVYPAQEEKKYKDILEQMVLSLKFKQ